VSDADLASGPVELTAGAGESEGLAGTDGHAPGAVMGDGTGPEDIGLDDVETEDGPDGANGAG
jgi:hypothetical protein